MSDVEIIGTPERTVTRRKFIMGVIAAGATTSSVGLSLQRTAAPTRGSSGSGVGRTTHHAERQRPTAARGRVEPRDARLHAAL